MHLPNSLGLAGPRGKKLVLLATATFAAISAFAVLGVRLGIKIRRHGGWGGSYLYKEVDQHLDELLSQQTLVSPLRQCSGGQISFEVTFASPDAGKLLQGKAAKAGSVGEMISGTAHGLPCRQKASQGGTCCNQPISLRKMSTDYGVFRQVFQCHFMGYLYELFGEQQPQYILDAGANIGMATMLFKLLWPQAVVVSLEPDASNFAMLQRNTQALQGVHTVNAGLWSRSANITQVGERGDWGKVFKEAAPGQPGMPAYSVQDLAHDLGIPAFDFVKVDIEGAEGIVFGPGADLAWIQHARAVSLEAHDFFASYFGLRGYQPISARIGAAFAPTGYRLVADNEHLMYLSPALAESVAARRVPSRAQLRSARLAVPRVPAEC